MKRVYEPNQP